MILTCRIIVKAIQKSKFVIIDILFSIYFIFRYNVVKYYPLAELNQVN